MEGLIFLTSIWFTDVAVRCCYIEGCQDVCDVVDLILIALADLSQELDVLLDAAQFHLEVLDLTLLFAHGVHLVAEAAEDVTEVAHTL